MKAAVLGATGCVGRHICTAFSREGHEVLGIARHQPPPTTAGATAHEADHRTRHGQGAHEQEGHGRRHDFVSLDVAAVDPAELARLLTLHRVDTVINATGGWLSTDAANEYHHVRLVENLLAATALMAPRPRLVQIGSIHEYGPVPPGRSIDETIPPRPETSYARTKLAGSEAILRATRAGTAEGVVLRAVNVCGPHVTRASFLGATVGKLRAARPGHRIPLTIADAKRDFVDVRDLARAVVKAAQAPVVGQVINIGRGEAVALRDMVSLLCAIAGFPSDAISEQGNQVESRGAGWTQADIKRAERLLGWRPQIDLSDSLRDMWTAAEQ